MKILKLTLIFVVIAGALFGLLMMTGVVDIDTSDTDDGGVDVSAECKTIDDAWDEVVGWDEATYKDLRASLDVKKDMNILVGYDYDVVNNRLIESSVNKAIEGYMSALHLSPVDEKGMKVQYDGVMFVKKKEGLKDNDARIVKIVNLNKLYYNIKKFISGYGFSPKFNGSAGTWTSFASLQQSKLKQASSYRNNPLYQQELKGIAGFENGLSDATVRQKTNAQKSSFYSTLCNQIISYYRTQEPTEENKAQLRRVFNQFCDESGGTGNQTLSDFTYNY